ncbi:MAG: aminomethyltransferase family protein [Anaerolineae bacterium]|nr:aminomethyltransferase family protein [Anaerolineae bacterium]
MPIPTPLHARTAPLNANHEWRDWAGYLSASLYEPSHEREYYAIRNAAALIDVSPLFKYEVSGPDALRAVDRLITRDATKCRVGQVLYTPWCDEDGQVIDDGTVARLAEDRFRITAADPNLRWFQDVAYGFDAQVEDVSTSLAALSLQGPNSREILRAVAGGIDLDALRYFHLAQGTVDTIPLTITRTGYTGDLGYELWVPAEYAVDLWDRLVDHGQAYGLLPVGMVAMDIARIEAGLLLIEVDYKSSAHAQIEAQKSSPFELGLGWAVALDAGDFVGRDALRAEKARGSAWAFAGVEVSWTSIAKLYAEEDLPPQVAGRASRQAIPVYRNGRQVGQLTSHTFSPILKRYIGIGTVLAEHAAPGATLDVEVTVEYRRKQARGTIVPTPFYDPAHKRR